jgi:predicted amidohydrolase YtcJ
LNRVGRISRISNARLLGRGRNSFWTIQIGRSKIVRIVKQRELLDDTKGKTSYDAKGNLVLPAFTDHHIHPFALGAKHRVVDLKNCGSIVELQERLRTFRRSSSVENDWLVGRGWDQGNFEERRFPTRSDLDEACVSPAVLLERICGHIGVVNTRALETASSLSVFPEQLMPKENDGAYTGIVKEGALDYFRSLVPTLTKAELKNDFLVAQREALSAGCAGLHCILSDSWRKELAAIRELDSSGELLIFAMLFLPASQIGEYERTESTLFRGRHFELAGFKLFADGSLGARTAALVESYADDPGNYGVLLFTAVEIETVARRAKSLGKILATHAIGDRAIKEVIEGYKRAGIKKSDCFRIEHCSLVCKEFLGDLRPYTISIQPSFATSDYWIKDRIGRTAEATPYPFKSILREAKMIGGSDAPVEDQSPLRGIRSAMNNPIRRESLSVIEAVRIYCDGSLAAGKKSEIVVLDSNEICKAKVDALIIGERIVHFRGTSNAFK